MIYGMKVYLYSLDLPYINIGSIKEYIKDFIDYDIEIKAKLIINNPEIIKKIAYTRVIDHKRPFQIPSVTEDNLDIEYILTMKPIIAARLYDGYRFQLVLNELINEYAIHIILSNRYLCTFDPDNYRYHLRSIIFGYPDIISIPGIVEAPAKPKEYYLTVYKYRIEGKNIDEVKTLFKDRIIDYDHRINEVIKGLILQAIKYHKTGDPFCSNKRCRLYNAHWQEELINSQLHGYICKKDKEILSTNR